MRIINGLQLHPELFEEVNAERCLLSECQGACCSGGAWLDVDQLKLIAPHRAAIAANLPPDRRDADTWFSAPAEDEDSPTGAEFGTTVIADPARSGETCCVFLRPDRLCALQLTSDQAGLPYPGLKPPFCALYPLTVRDGVIQFDHATEQNFGGANCRRASRARQPLHRIFKAELLLLLGEAGYAELDR